MTWRPMDDAGMSALLRSAREVAVVGASARPDRPSHYVSEYLLGTGHYRMQFVNPALQQVLGHSVYPSLQALPTTPDLVVVFRRAEDLPDLLADALAAHAGALWIQLGIVNLAVAHEAQAAGVPVVMDR